MQTTLTGNKRIHRFVNIILMMAVGRRAVYAVVCISLGSLGRATETDWGPTKLTLLGTPLSDTMADPVPLRC